MGLIRLSLLLVSVLHLTCSVDHVHQLIEKDAENCEDVCEKTYPLHTYPLAEHLDSCKRGCRFFSMLDVLGTKKDANQTLDSCLSSCAEAYSNTTEKLACSNGCENQITFSLKETQPQTAHMLQPLMYVQAIYTNVVGQMSEFIASTWTLYIQEDTGKIVVSKNGLDEIPIAPEIISVDGDSDFEKKLFGNDMKSFAEETVRREELIRVQESVDRRSVDWLSCISQQSGFPRMILLLVVLLAIVVAVWLCCATAATAQEQKVKSEIKSDSPPPPYDEKVPLLLSSEDEDELI